MGIKISIPRIEGLLAVFLASSTAFSTSYTFGPTEYNAFGVSTRLFDQSSTENTLAVTVPTAKREGSSPTGVTDLLSAHGPISSDLADTFTIYPSTATVTSTITSTHVAISTATVVASRCPTTTISISSTVQSAAPPNRYTLSSIETPHRSNVPAETSSSYRASTPRSTPSGSKAVSSPSSFAKIVTGSKTILSSVPVLKISASTASTLSSVVFTVSNKHPSSFSPMSKDIPVATASPTNPIRVASMSALDRGSLYIRRPRIAYGEPVYALSSSGPSVNTAHVAKETGTPKTTASPESTRPVTKIANVTTTTVYRIAVTNHTTTTNVTVSPTSCHPGTIAGSSPPSSKSCTSATPNPSPPTNNTCAEDGLLEYSTTPQPPDTLGDCAAACLADTSCLSFTFIPSKSTCYTSLYPLADSAFAGTQQYHIYNYDRDCYSCSS